MCRVTLGKPVEQYNAIKIAHAPPGHHSVIGRPSAGGLSYPEYAIYRGEQVCRISNSSVMIMLCATDQLIHVDVNHWGGGWGGRQAFASSSSKLACTIQS